jgi:hypothetical protein
MANIFDRKKDGIPTLAKIAQVMCRALGKFTPFIVQKYPDNAALLAALAAAQAACNVLNTELAKVRSYGD